MPMEKSPPELVERFATVLARFPEATRRQMFGFPAAFIGGNMVTSLHEHRWVVRLPDVPRSELLALPGAAPFEPMAGRAMKGYAVLPSSVAEDPDAAAAWVERAIAYVRTLPAKR
jgi:hypothetical protein